ncbi:MAG TPA: adhesin [Paenibacillus sp.]|uniref:adhesin n=1 Tax=Paenibacillus TaxID=44249 RepID=UPI000BA145F8|nr:MULTISPECIES: adhesin [Paenibacillus]OZQ60433.1 adhesin [Paenibacillus taichungensis]HBU82419.1 adhesin [Paenibacillus sp.]
MVITDGAKAYIEGMMKEAGVHTLRFALVGGGCCGPSYQLGLTDPLENDVIQEINTIRVAVDPEIETTVESITLDVERYDDGLGLVVSGGSSCC